MEAFQHSDSTAIIRTQQKREAKFLCSACGADRGCDCNAPAVKRIAEYDKANPGKSTRQAAADLGLSQSAVQKARGSGQVNTECSPEPGVPDGTGGHQRPQVTGRDGKRYPATRPQGTEHSAPYVSPVAAGKATLAEFYTANHVIGILERVIHDLGVLDFPRAARGCNAADVERINRDAERLAKLLDEMRTAMGQCGHQTPDDLTIPEFMRRESA